MDLSFSSEQELLRDALRRYLQSHYAFETRRAAVLSAEGWRRDFWRGLAELGVLGAALPERAGGSGGGAVETLIVMEELGRALVVEPYLETCVIAGSLLAGIMISSNTAGQQLERIASGESIVTLAGSEASGRHDLTQVTTRAVRDGSRWRLSGSKCVVIAAPWADQLIVTARDADGLLRLFLVAPGTEGIAMTAYPTIDGRRAADLRLDDVLLPANALLSEQDATPLLEQANDAAVAAICAEGCGVMQRLLDDTIEYCRQRKQFGQTIASFQVLQHRMVDMHLQLELARAATLRAALRLDAAPRERAMAVSTAKVTVSQAARFIGQNAVQLHGGMGMTDELPLGSYFKRATAIEYEFGSADHHLARHARLERESG